MIQAFDIYTKDGNVVIVTTEFNEDWERVVVENHITHTRAIEIFKALSESLGIDPINALKDIREHDIKHKVEQGSFILPLDIRGKIQHIIGTLNPSAHT